MERVPQLIVKILYGSGLRVMEAVRLEGSRHLLQNETVDGPFGYRGKG
ncbi:MAG: hypothetical protein KKD21_13290 [Proteobacteria bacterium]|nr:hypothetical protein [Pseudomonadota bacterium]MBU1697993.1 hypothetical protein [Pseudomonadota bacterium]